MPITRTAMVDDDGSGLTGTIINNAWKQELYNQIDAYVDGTWVNIPFDAAMYTASAGTWTVSAANQATFKYMRLGKTIWVMLQINSSTTSASTVRLYVTMPASVPVANGAISAPVIYSTGGVGGTGYAELDLTSKFGLLRDITGTPWVVGAASTFIRGEWFYSIA